MLLIMHFYISFGCGSIINPWNMGEGESAGVRGMLEQRANLFIAISAQTDLLIW
jgi:hypothetical protein